MALSAKDWEVVMRAPLFKAMGPAIARAMINDRAPRTYARGETIFNMALSLQNLNERPTTRQTPDNSACS